MDVKDIVKVSSMMGVSGLITVKFGTEQLQGSSQPCVTNQEEVILDGAESPKPLAGGRGYLNQE